MKKILMILIVLICELCLLKKIEANETKSQLVFSELTVDKCPGDNGSWIELYNKGKENINVEGFIIICNNKKIFTFPNIIIPSKYLFLIKFTKNTKKEIQKDTFERLIICSSPNKKNRIKADYNLIDHSPFQREIRTNSELKRSPGYCVLFKKNISKKNLLDYVAWGGKYLKIYPNNVINKKHFIWAQEKGIWEKFRGVFIGIEGGPGNDPWPQNDAVIARMNFSKNKQINNCWQVICPNLSKMISYPVIDQEITPGKPNQWFIPSLSGALAWGKNDEITINESRFTIDHRRFDLGREENEIFELQIAKDPYFEEIIYNKKTKLPTIIDKQLLQSGYYYARTRVKMKKCQTNWSPTIIFSYDIK